MEGGERNEIGEKNESVDFERFCFCFLLLSRARAFGFLVTGLELGSLIFLCESTNLSLGLKANLI